MVFKRVWTVAVVAALLVAGSAVAEKPRVNPGMWIVELDDPPTVRFAGGAPESLERVGGTDAKTFAPTAPAVTGARRLRVDDPAVASYAAHLDRIRGVVIERASQRIGRALVPRFVYRHVRNGFAARLDAREAELLAGLPGVRSVVPDIVETLHTDAGPGWIGAPGAWAGSGGVPGTRGEGTVLGVIDSGVNWASIFFDPSQSSLPIGNPRPGFLGLCSDGTLDVCNDKLIGIYDFTDEETDGFDPDGHGSHTASTAVGLPFNFNLDFGSGPIGFQTSGVAPRASFIAYKACQAPADSPTGQFECPGSATSAALEQAIEDEVDAINYSIGGDPFNPWSEAGNQRLFLNVREAGIVPVTSAGNGGPGDATVGSPANVPWVMAVANAHHGRRVTNRLVETTGGPFDLGQLVGDGITGDTPTRPIVHARDFGNALCGTGPAELGPDCADNTGASNPFDPGTFDGQIVVCDRGTYGRVEKGKNVFDAGAGGMILANTDAQGESTATFDDHCLPATHIGDEQGDRLRDWLDSGANHRGRLNGAERFIDAGLAGEINDSSARGPSVGAPGLMKPNVTAPGTFVLAALTEINDTEDGPGPNAANRLGFLTGTSMSSPHVAGAALLLRSAHPGWDVDAVISVLETTADPGIVSNADGSPVRILDRGAGGVQVDRAIRAGLYLPVTEAEFLAANPAGLNGGDPSEINLPGLVDDNCVATCTFTRTVRALESGTWETGGEGDLAISVTPASFTLSAGQEQELVVEVSRGSAQIGEWGSGSVVLEATSGGFATQRLPVGVLVSAGELPPTRNFTAASNRGRGEIEISELIEIDELVFRTSALLRPEQREPSLAQDSTRNDPFDGPSGTTTELFEVPEGALLLHAETFDSQASDIDLFVGRDLNGDGQAQESEVVCQSRSPNDLELCDIDTPAPGTWWVLVQNWQSSGFGGNQAPFEFAVFAEDDDPSLVVTAPGAHDGGPLTVPVYWDQPAMERNDRWMGVVAVSSAPVTAADIGTVPVTVTRTGDNAPAETALFEAQPYPVVLPSGAVHDRMYIDLPPGMDELIVSVEGPVSDVTIRRRGFSELAASVPQTPPAPASVLVQATRDGNQWSASVANPDGGRYFVVLENANPVESSAMVTASVVRAQVATPPPLGTFPIPGRGAWSAARDVPIGQGIDWQVGGGGRFAIWYTYDEAGVPTFYITDTVPEVDTFFSAVLFRPTSNDVRASLKVVGEVQVTQISEGRLMYAWRLNGNHGAEMFDPVSGSTCPTVATLGDDPVPLLGTWFSPDTAAGGSTVLITETAEAWIRFYYDRHNSPRWVIADIELPATLPGGNRMEVLDFRGFCIYCDEVPVTSEVVGTLERVFIDETTVREVTDYVAGPPIDTSIATDRNLVPLSFPTPDSCPNP